MGMLNAKSVFGMPAMASSFFNIGSIVAGVGLGYWMDPKFGSRALIGLALGTLIEAAHCSSRCSCRRCAGSAIAMRRIFPGAIRASTPSSG